MKPWSNFLGFLKSTKQQKINFKIWSNKGAAFLKKNCFFDSCLKNHLKFIIKITNFLQFVRRIFWENWGVRRNNFVLLFGFPWQFHLQKNVFAKTENVLKQSSELKIFLLVLLHDLLKQFKNKKIYIVPLNFEYKNVFLCQPVHCEHTFGIANYKHKFLNNICHF